MATSYCSVETADTYFGDRRNPATWTGLTTAAKQAALIIGTDYLDREYRGRWKGARASRTQARDWPRVGVADVDGSAVPSTETPLAVQYATAEAALRHAAGDALLSDPLTAPGTISRETRRAGSVEKTTEYVGGRSQLPRYPLIDGLLVGLIVPAGLMRLAPSEVWAPWY